MKSDHAFIAERIAAQHCPELLRSGPAPGELLPLLTQLGERLALALETALAPVLSPVLGSETPQVITRPARSENVTALAAELGALAAHVLYNAGASEVPVLVSLDAGAMFALVDRTFGGKGEVPSPMPQSFPMSVELMIDRLEGLVAGCLAEALELTAENAVRSERRDGSLITLAPFPDGMPLAVLRLEVCEAGREPWPINIALLEAMLPALLGDGAGRPRRVRGRADPASEPFAGLPLELTAVLVDMRISMATIAAIQPGSVLPVSVARNVPLRIGGRTIASGSIGAADDQVAIRITHAFT